MGARKDSAVARFRKCLAKIGEPDEAREREDVLRSGRSTPRRVILVVTPLIPTYRLDSRCYRITADDVDELRDRTRDARLIEAYSR